MTPLIRTLDTIASAVACLFLVGSATAITTTAHPRSDRQLCAEVAHELDMSVHAQLITEKEATQLKAKCFKLFAR
jgi:hypothetical protein